jgi:hypothetical protein
VNLLLDNCDGPICAVFETIGNRLVRAGGSSLLKEDGDLTRNLAARILHLFHLAHLVPVQT